MKKLILFCLCLITVAAMAQEDGETFTLKAVKKGEEPKAVMDAIKQDFPKAVVQDLKVLPAKLYGEHWSVDLQGDAVNDATLEYYQVNMKEGNETYKAVYNKSGKLRSSKLVVKEAQLPAEVKTAITKKYPDWKVVKDREKITYKEGKEKEAYHIEIEKDKMYRSLFFTNGKLAKDVLVKYRSA